MLAATCAGALCIVLVGMGMELDQFRTDIGFLAPLLVVVIGVLANILTASNVRVTASPDGFTIRWGLIGWPRGTYRAEDIEHAEVIDLAWWRVSYGFWWTPNRTNCTVRSGPTVRLTLRNQRIISITVPEPADAVAALRQAPERPPRNT